MPGYYLEPRTVWVLPELVTPYAKIRPPLSGLVGELRWCFMD